MLMGMNLFKLQFDFISRILVGHRTWMHCVVCTFTHISHGYITGTGAIVPVGASEIIPMDKGKSFDVIPEKKA